MIGTLLANRYLIEKKIGEGGMSIVYQARDTVLGRTVAVKVLREQYAADEEFVERFRREALAAASLSHPNIVTVYDVGRMEGMHYIVMEYVAGENLKSVIKHRAPLPPLEAAQIAYQICEALDHAHKHDIIHRDIKPHNILVTPDGRVKVADFGIARAASSTTLTETGIVLGSVHYFSPEQARGDSIGPQSDIYSAGVILYEMLTGNVPFQGDTPIAVALKQIRETPPSARELNPGIPAVLEYIRRRAMDKDLGRRYASAGEMAKDISKFIRDEEEARRILPEDDSPTQALNQPVPADAGTRGADLEDTVRLEGAGAGVDMARNKHGKVDRRERRRRIWAVTLIVAAVFAGGIFGLWWAFSGMMAVGEVQTPKVIGLSIDDAARVLREHQLTMNIGGRAFSNEFDVDHVISQDPEPGRKVKVNRTVTVTVSKGQELVEVPDLFGQTVREAEISLSQADLALGQQSSEYSSDVAAGRIVSQNPPAGSRLAKKMSVDVAVSKGPAPDLLPLPNFVGQAYDAVVGQLSQLGLAPGRLYEQEATGVEPGIIIAQNPEAGTLVSPGSSVDFVVSRGSGGGGALPPSGSGVGSPPQSPASSGTPPPSASQGATGSWPSTTPTSPLSAPAVGTGSAATGTAGGVRRADVEIRVPDGPEKQRVVITVVDSLGTKTVYDRVHRPGDRIVHVVESRGKQPRARVYLDGALVWEMSF